MQTEKTQLEGKSTMLGTRFTQFPTLSVDPKVRISRSASRMMTDYFSYLLLEIIVFCVCVFNNIIALISFDFIQNLKLKLYDGQL